MSYLSMSRSPVWGHCNCIIIVKWIAGVFFECLSVWSKPDKWFVIARDQLTDVLTCFVSQMTIIIVINSIIIHRC